MAAVSLIRKATLRLNAAGDIVEGTCTVAQKGEQIFELMLRTASGEKSKSEVHGMGSEEFVPWYLGAVM